MKLRVQYTAQLRTVTGRPEDVVELPDGSNLATLLNHLRNLLGDAAAFHLVATSGKLPRNLLIVVNGIAASGDDAADTVLSSDDVVLLLPPIAGG
jgi:molybdopterin converting factor small subunit